MITMLEKAMESSQSEEICEISSTESVDNSFITINMGQINDKPCKSCHSIVTKYKNFVTLSLIILLTLMGLVSTVENVYLNAINMNKILPLSDMFVNISMVFLSLNKDGPAI